MALAQVAQATQPACVHELGEVHQHHRPLLPVDQDTTPAALSPLRRQNPREEPGALAAHAGICAGGEEKSSSLPRPMALSSDPFDLKPRFDLDNVWSVRRWVLKWSAVANMTRIKSITNHWFVSVETPKQLRLSSSAAPRPRETKSFPTEIEAKQFATAMLSEGRKVTAGTLMPHQPIRRTI